MLVAMINEHECSRIYGRSLNSEYAWPSLVEGSITSKGYGLELPHSPEVDSVCTYRQTNRYCEIVRIYVDVYLSMDTFLKVI